MGFFGNRTPFEDIYENADTASDLPWHRDDPWPMLERVVSERTQTGRALDLGCGAGEFAVYLARNGYDVTGVDRHQVPLQMASERAESANVDLTLVQADVLQWASRDRYDLVLDSGCYHGLTGADRTRYRDLLRDRLSPDGDFILIHFGKKHLLDWRPVGPTRRRRAAVQDEFSPWLEEIAYSEEIQTGVPLPVGPRPLAGQYWFRRVDAPKPE